jgi:hypothetical protein
LLYRLPLYSSAPKAIFCIRNDIYSKKIRGFFYRSVLRRDYIGSAPTQGSHEEAEFKKDIVSRRALRDFTANYIIVRRKHENGKVALHDCGFKSFDRRIRRLENVLVPNLDAKLVFGKPGLKRTRDRQGFL